VTLDRSPGGLAELYEDIGRQLLLAPSDSPADAMSAVSRTAVHRVPGADWASVTEGRNGSFVTVAATDQAALAVDQIQYELGTGPCVDAILQDTVFHTDDLRTDGRWPTFAKRAAETSDIRSMLSFRLFLEDDARIAGLNIYSTTTAAFGEDAKIVGTLIATHGALAISAAAARENAAHLQRALANSREIGVAMGVLMNQHKVSRTQAFDLLRVASQNSNRKLADIATDVADTGALPLPGGSSNGRAAVPRPGPRPTRRTVPRNGSA